MNQWNAKFTSTETKTTVRYIYPYDKSEPWTGLAAAIIKASADIAEFGNGRDADKSIRLSSTNDSDGNKYIYWVSTTKETS